MTTTEARILRALTPGGQLTIDQIARHTDMSIRRTRRNAESLVRQGFAVGRVGVHRDAWALTQRGARFASSAHGRAVLDTVAP